MTERGAADLQRDATRLRIGPSGLAWRGGRLVIDLAERTAPWGTRVCGQLCVTPTRLGEHRFALDAGGRHHWSPIAPVARIDVQLDRPALHWQGAAYLDTNRGARPLEADFRRWDWSRAALPDGRAAALYDVERSDGSALSLALRFDAVGGVEPMPPPAPRALPRSGWRIERHTRCDAGGSEARVRRSLEDGPFYARALLETQWWGEPVLAVHESLSLQRFASPWVQAMLPFRMPRRAG